MAPASLCCQVVRALESDSDRGLLYQGMKPGQKLEDQSEYGSEYGGTTRYTSDSGEFDSDYSSNSGLRSFHKRDTNASRQQGLSIIQSGEHSTIAEEDDYFENDDESSLVPAPAPAPVHAFKPPTLASQQFSPPSIHSGEYDPDAESSDFPGAYRKRSPPSYAPPRAGLPNNGMSGFMGGPPPPPPGRYIPANFSGEVDYVPIGKTVSFAPIVDEKKF